MSGIMLISGFGSYQLGSESQILYRERLADEADEYYLRSMKTF